jgi:hypothetical protein
MKTLLVARTMKEAKLCVTLIACKRWSGRRPASNKIGAARALSQRWVLQFALQHGKLSLKILWQHKKQRC